MNEFDLESLSREMPFRMPEHFMDEMTEKVVSQISRERQHQSDGVGPKELDLESLSREMPFRMPEHFIDEMTESVVSRISRERRRHTERRLYAWFAGAASVAAVAVLLLHPFGSSLNVPDYDSISQCASIDELFQNMSSEELGLYSMMSNYYGD
ncbi:MAG: hypothetical protein MJY75_06675 [Bacteroidaceae bacterium]|nr:hypothetical protein [Bacteroidaceae bacterium]